MKGKPTKQPKPKARKPARPRPKATKATVDRRVEELLRIRLDGAELWDIREYVREKEAEEVSAWQLATGETPLSDPQLYRYLQRVDSRIAESCRESRPKLLRLHLAKRRNLYAKALNQGDVRSALAVARDEAQLLDLYPSPEAKLLKEVEQLQRTVAEAQARRAAEVDELKRELAEARRERGDGGDGEAQGRADGPG